MKWGVGPTRSGQGKCPSSNYIKHNTRSTRTNRVSITNPRGKWSSELLEATMDVVERNITSLWGANKFWGIPITSLFDHLYGKTRSRKIGPLDVLMKRR
jgi:hypothetical protein